MDSKLSKSFEVWHSSELEGDKKPYRRLLFCAINLTGINRKKRKSLLYPNLPSALRPVAHCDEIPIPVFKELPDVPNENLDVNFEENDDLNDNDFVPKSSEPILFNQDELSNLIRDLNLSKESSELLASQIND